MNQGDPKGYYRRLGLSPGTSFDEIKLAFRRRARDLHPDRNPSASATAEFQLLQEAYSVLGDPEARARYDTITVETPTREQESAETEGIPDPIVCSVCEKVTAQPRYVIYFEVKSALVVTYRTPIQGIFCPSCAEKRVLRATVVTWFLGWWGFPWGLIYSIEAICRNLLGGMQPRDVNAKLLAYQAWWFARQGQNALARAVATDALTLAEGTERDPKGLELRRSIHALLAALDDGSPIRHLRNGWALSNRPSVVQAVLILMVVIAIAGAAAYEHPPVGTTVRPQAVVPPSVAAPAPSPMPSRPPASSFAEPAKELPANGTYRRYWAQHEGEVLAPLKIITKEGSPNYFVKVVDWESGKLVLTVSIRSGQTADVRVPLGSYRLKYASGTTWYGTKYLYGPETSYAHAEKRLDFTMEGEQVSGFRIELIKQVGGNLKTANIRPEDF